MASTANPKLKQQSLKELQRIVLKDYGVELTQEEVDQFGFSLLKVTHIAVGVFNRADGISSSQLTT